MLTVLPVIVSAQTQNEGTPLPRWNVKTNLLYDATATVNLGVEVRTGRRTSLDIPFNYNAWTVPGDRRCEHLMAQPEFRVWTRGTFDGHFFGLHGHYASYDIARLPFSQYTKDHRFEGWLAGAGVSYGYRWNLTRRIALEASVGVGYAYMNYDLHRLNLIELPVGEAKHYFGPTKVGLSLVVGIGGGKTEKTGHKHTTAYIPPQEHGIQPQPAVIPGVALAASFITPRTETVKTRSESGKAYLDFPAGRSAIVADFKDNAAELRKMRESIESVTANPYATITAITITGYASPEGTSAANLAISGYRAQALRNYIGATYGLPADLFIVREMGEDWYGLEEMVVQSDLPQREQVLAVIRGTDNLDRRERRIMDISGGEPYRWIRAMLFSGLRRVEYRLDYTVAAFTVEQGKQVMKTRPGTLSLGELFLIAGSYPAGSDDFNEVLKMAALLYPDSDIANMNAAASALERKDTASAARYLGRVKDHSEVYWNNAGILAWLTGDSKQAAECFARAGGYGAANAMKIMENAGSKS